MNRKVSVIIPTYNRASMVGDAIESVLKQDLDDIEIIVVDDGSKDETERVVRRYLQSRGDKVRYLKQENKGVAAARNKGIDAARGEYIAFLDSDDTWMTTTLGEKIAYLDKNPQIGMAFCNGIEKTAAGAERKITETLLRHREKVMANDLERAFEMLMESNFIGVSGVMVRKRCLEDVGAFDEALPSVEDFELWLRITVKHKVHYFHECLYWRRLQSDNLTADRTLYYHCKSYVFEKIETINPSYFNAHKKDLTARISRYHFEAGYLLFDKYDFKKSRAHFIKSVTTRFNLKSLVYWTITLLGPALAARLRR